MLRLCKILRFGVSNRYVWQNTEYSQHHVTAIEIRFSCRNNKPCWNNLFMRNIARSVGPASVTLVVQLRVHNEDYNPQ